MRANKMGLAGGVVGVSSRALNNPTAEQRVPRPAQQRPGRWEPVGLAVLAAAAAVWFFASAGPAQGGFFTREPSGYYGMQTAGFRNGHLHVALKPAPGLLALADPYDPVANAPYRAHDMTLWQGKYYLYYGVSPVLILFWPFAALTGWYPTEPMAVATFCALGVALSLALLGALRRRCFPAAPGWALLAGAAVVAFANPVASLTQLPQFYQVPIAAAFALHMGMLWAIYAALHSGARGGLIWLTAASVCYGLSIGARPNYLLSGFALVVPWLVLIWRRRHEGAEGAALRHALAAFGPAVLAGGGVLLYNWLRFGAATEFGMKYTLGGERIPNVKLMGLEYVVPHLGDYLLQGGNWSRYFPFFSAPTGVPHGALRYMPWLWMIPAALAVGATAPRGLRGVVVAIAVAAGANLALLCGFFGLTDRYPPDYVPAAVVLASIGGLALAESPPKRRRTAALGALLAGATIVVALAVWVKRWPDQTAWLPVARIANLPTSWWERFRGDVPGNLRLELELPSGKEGSSEPIVHTGLSADSRNWLQIDYLPGDSARLSFFHAGLGLLPTREFAIPPSRRITVELASGALLPPAAHPLFETWTAAERATASREVAVKVDGVEVLRAALGAYESTPDDLLIGRMGWSAGAVQPTFTGRVLRVEKSPAKKPVLFTADGWAGGPMEITLRLPADKSAGRDPLVVTGEGENFDVLYCEYAGLGRVSFALYHRGSEPAVGPIMEFDPLAAHTLQVWLGSMAETGRSDPPETAVPAARRLTVVFDGNVALNQEQAFYAARAGTLVLGENRLTPDVVGPRFTGRIEAIKPVALEALPDPGQMRQYGAVDMTVVFARGAEGAAEPLVVTGAAGAGNFIYLRYLAGDKMVFGFDHWGLGGIVGQPVEVDTWKPHRLRMTMGSLYPPDEDVGDWRRRVRVWLDDKVVLDGEYVCHPSTRLQVRIGENVIGGSTCGPKFSGQIQKLDRTSRP